MKHSVHGCACCGGAFAGILRGNRIVADVSQQRHFATNFAGCLSRASGIDRRDFVKTGAAAVMAGAFGVGCRPSVQSAPATVFTNGTILTVDSDFSEAGAIAIRGNRILSVGTDAEVLAAAGREATVVDLEGKVVLPGFVEAHTHPVVGAVLDELMTYVGMARFSTAAEVLDELRAEAATKAPGEWIMARNFDPAIQEGPGELTFADLDSVSTAHPIFVLNASGHLAYANSKAFEAAGITEDVVDPPGAEYSRDESGKLTGVMKNNVAWIPVMFANPAVAEVDPAESLIGLSQRFARVGLTTMSELAFGGVTGGPGDIAIIETAAESGRIVARLRAYALYTYEDAWDEAGLIERLGHGTDLVRICGYKLIADGSNQGFTGLQREPYLGSEDRGLAYMETADMVELGTKWASKGWLLAIHGNGDAAIDNVLDACEAMRDAGIDLDRVRARIEHCSILHDDQIARMKELGVSASFLIGHVHYWGTAMRDEVFGEEKARLLDRCRSVEDAGIRYTLHSDFFVTDPDPLHMIEMAVTRRTWKQPDYILAPNERISVESAIRAVTSEAAWQLGSEDEVGSLEAGKLADFVILDNDPRKVEPDRIKDIRVLETWMDGKQVFEA